MSMMERLAGYIMLQWGWKRALIAFFAGAFAVLALAPFDFFAAVFVSFPLLVWLLDGASGDPDKGSLGRIWPAFSVGWWFGFGYFLAGLWWLGGALMVEAGSFAWALPLAVFGLPALLALFFGLGTAIARLLWSDGFGRLAALAFGLTLMEWLRGFIFTGFPWNTIGYGAMPAPLAMQSATVVGLLGVTALSIVVFSAPALLGTRRGAGVGVAVAVLLTAVHIGFGAYELRQAPAGAAAGGPVVRLVQPSIPQGAKWNADARESIFTAHLDLTARPPQGGTGEPAIIVWPETAVPFILTEAPRALAAIADALSPGQLLAAGAVRIDDSRQLTGPRYYNSITVIDDGGEIVAAADKVHLVPFGEYLPFEEWFASVGISAIAETPQGFAAAADRSLLELGDGLTALPLICYEAVFPLDLSRFDRRPDVILNVTNDAWYGATPGPYQHFRQAQLRAVETRTPLIRAANNGISAVTDAYGRIVEGLALDAVGAVDVALPPKPAPKWDSDDRQRNFWLIIGILLLVAVAARSGLIMRMN